MANGGTAPSIINLGPRQRSALLPSENASANGQMGGWATEPPDALFPPQLEFGTPHTYTHLY